MTHELHFDIEFGESSTLKSIGLKADDEDDSDSKTRGSITHGPKISKDV